MKAHIPVELNHWRLREGEMATDEDSNYEGCFIIPSAKKDPDRIGHPFDYHQIFQIQSSEIAGGVQSGTDWEKVTVIVKAPQAGGALSQRQPNIREIRWIKSLFWEDWETCCSFFGSHEAHLAIDHRILHLFRKADGSMDVPELFREMLPDAMLAQTEEVAGEEFEGRRSVFDLLRGRREKAHKDAREEKKSNAGRDKAEAKRILDTARVDPDSLGYKISEANFKRLRSLLGIE